MNTIIFLVEIIIVLPALTFSLYLALLTLFALVQRNRQKLAPTSTPRRFAILVPAHDEEEVIGTTLQSMLRINYPKELFDVAVIADNCTDRTAVLARANGALAFERFDSVNKGKGRALRWCMDQLISSDKGYDAFVIVDADTVVEPNILSVMNNHLETGAECIQCSDLVSPKPGEWSPEMTRIAFILHNYVRPLGKMLFGLSMGLNGNGMCFSRELIVTMPWDSYSRVEDLEYSLQLALAGVRVQFAPETTVHAIMPSEARTAESQRRRWEIARFALVMKYMQPLLYAAIRNRSIMAFDMFMELITPAFVNLTVLTGLLLILQIVGLAITGSHWFVWTALLCILILLLQTFHVFGGLKAAHARKDDFLVLANLPRYIFWKMSLYVKTFMNGDDKHWVRTGRGG